MGIQGVNVSAGVPTRFRVTHPGLFCCLVEAAFSPRWTRQWFGRSYNFEAPFLGVAFPPGLEIFWKVSPKSGIDLGWSPGVLVLRQILQGGTALQSMVEILTAQSQEHPTPPPGSLEIEKKLFAFTLNPRPH